MIAVQPLAAQVGVAPACQALGVSRASFYRRQRSTPGHQQPRPTPARALCEAEREQILDVLVGPRFVDRAPAEVVATLLDEGHYLCSERTMYRILAADQPVRERRNQREHPQYTKPELVATAPNQTWSWDITKLLGSTKWTYFYLYVVLDIFSRYAVGWMVADRENSALAGRLIEETCHKQGGQPHRFRPRCSFGGPAWPTQGRCITGTPLDLLDLSLRELAATTAPLERGPYGPGFEQKPFAILSEILAGRVSVRYPECLHRLIGIVLGILDLAIDWRKQIFRLTGVQIRLPLLDHLQNLALGRAIAGDRVLIGLVPKCLLDRDLAGLAVLRNCQCPVDDHGERRSRVRAAFFPGPAGGVAAHYLSGSACSSADALVRPCSCLGLPVEFGPPAGHGLPPIDRHVHISRIDLHAAETPTGSLRCDECGA